MAIVTSGRRSERSLQLPRLLAWIVFATAYVFAIVFVLGTIGG